MMRDSNMTPWGGALPVLPTCSSELVVSRGKAGHRLTSAWLPCGLFVLMLFGLAIDSYLGLSLATKISPMNDYENRYQAWFFIDEFSIGN